MASLMKEALLKFGVLKHQQTINGTDIFSKKVSKLPGVNLCTGTVLELF